MAALTSSRKATVQIGDKALPDIENYPVADNVKCFAGGIAVLNAGYAEPATTATGLIALGRFEADADNTIAGHTAGGIGVDVRRGVFPFANSAAGDAIAQADVGKDCYLVDDQTVAKTDGTGTRSRAGKIFRVDSTNSLVYVLLGLGV